MSSPISGFTAIPNPQMLAFMGAQSFIMMYQAGEGWQYGKRKISAMSNEEFNKLTPEIVMEKQAVVLRNALPTIEKSMNDMTPMIRTIIAQYGDFLREAIATIPQLVANVTGQRDQQQTTIKGAPGVASFITGLPVVGLGKLRDIEQSSVGQPVQAQTQNKLFDMVNKIRQMDLTQLHNMRSAINNGSTYGFNKTEVNSVLLAWINRLIQGKTTKDFRGQITKLSGTPTPTSTRSTKRVSQQTLRLERNRLVNRVAQYTAEVKKFTALALRNRTTRSGAGYRNKVIIAVKNLKNYQQLLVNFLHKWQGKF